MSCGTTNDHYAPTRCDDGPLADYIVFCPTLAQYSAMWLIGYMWDPMVMDPHYDDSSSWRPRQEIICAMRYMWFFERLGCGPIARLTSSWHFLIRESGACVYRAVVVFPAAAAAWESRGEASRGDLRPWHSFVYGCALTVHSPSNVIPPWMKKNRIVCFIMIYSLFTLRRACLVNWSELFLEWTGNTIGWPKIVNTSIFGDVSHTVMHRNG